MGITRACGGTGDTVWAVDDRRRLLRFSGVEMAAEVVSVPGLISVRDVACAANGTMVVLSGDNQVHRWTPGSVNATPVAIGWSR